MEIQNMLGYLLNASARFIKREMDENIKKYNLTTSQWAVIKLLYNKKELTQAQIAEELKSDRATAGNVILNLNEKKYVDKVIGEKDRRTYVICLTDKAVKIVDEVELIADEVIKKALKGMDDNQIKALYEGLNNIISNLYEGEGNYESKARNI
ncbi:MarR family transcriptional regulator [Clostridium sp. YIM B02551]|uniref:MarR family winged helix-turn-helix transcriptional regulator n=1 Tax=Clostridium sp. YIM B02551 TaxID=2910679 RepID=UPI001EEBB566|nr:MarR family transcriptional regulator [Clostridium sp. YIM B02551]